MLLKIDACIKKKEITADSFSRMSNTTQLANQIKKGWLLLSNFQSFSENIFDTLKDIGRQTLL